MEQMMSCEIMVAILDFTESSDLSNKLTLKLFLIL